jgi:hypothetical protein
MANRTVAEEQRISEEIETLSQLYRKPSPSEPEPSFQTPAGVPLSQLQARELVEKGSTVMAGGEVTAEELGLVTYTTTVVEEPLPPGVKRAPKEGVPYTPQTVQAPGEPVTHEYGTKTGIYPEPVPAKKEQPASYITTQEHPVYKPTGYESNIAAKKWADISAAAYAEFPANVPNLLELVAGPSSRKEISLDYTMPGFAGMKAQVPDPFAGTAAAAGVGVWFGEAYLTGKAYTAISPWIKTKVMPKIAELTKGKLFGSYSKEMKVFYPKFYGDTAKMRYVAGKGTKTVEFARAIERKKLVNLKIDRFKEIKNKIVVWVGGKETPTIRSAGYRATALVGTEKKVTKTLYTYIPEKTVYEYKNIVDVETIGKGAKKIEVLEVPDLFMRSFHETRPNVRVGFVWPEKHPKTIWTYQRPMPIIKYKFVPGDMDITSPAAYNIKSFSRSISKETTLFHELTHLEYPMMSEAKVRAYEKTFKSQWNKVLKEYTFVTENIKGFKITPKTVHKAFIRRYKIPKEILLPVRTKAAFKGGFLTEGKYASIEAKSIGIYRQPPKIPKLKVYTLIPPRKLTTMKPFLPPKEPVRDLVSSAGLKLAKATKARPPFQLPSELKAQPVHPVYFDLEDELSFLPVPKGFSVTTDHKLEQPYINIATYPDRQDQVQTQLNIESERQRSLLKQIVGVKNVQKPVFMQVETESQKGKQSVGLSFKQRDEQKQVQIQIDPLKEEEGIFTPSPPLPGTGIGPPWYVPLAPPPYIPTRKPERVKFGKWKPISARPRYSPSLLGIMLKKKARKPPRLITGVEIRPMIAGKRKRVKFMPVIPKWGKKWKRKRIRFF